MLLPLVALAERTLVAECTVGDNDEYFNAGDRLVLAFAIESSTESLWVIRDDGVAFLGGGPASGPFEVNGGTWSSLRTRAVRVFLHTRTFRLVEASEPLDSLGVSKSLERFELAENSDQCEVDYSQLRHYIEGEWREDAVREDQ